MVVSLALAQSQPIFIRQEYGNEAPPIKFNPNPESPPLGINLADRLANVVESIVYTISDTGVQPELVSVPTAKEVPAPIVLSEVVVTSNCSQERLLAEIKPIFPDVEVKRSIGDFSLDIDPSVSDDIRAGLALFESLFTLSFTNLNDTQTRELPDLLAASSCVLKVDLVPNFSCHANFRN